MKKNTIFYLVTLVGALAIGGFIFTNSRAETLEAEMVPAEAKWEVKLKSDKMVMGQPVEAVDLTPMKRSVFVNRIRTGSLPASFFVEAENTGAEKNDDLSCKVMLNGVEVDGDFSVTDRDEKCVRGVVSIDLAAMTETYKEEQILEFLNAFLDNRDFSVKLD